jgi:multidrug efflux pump subunit AcrA (membrane-fusion protein)
VTDYADFTARTAAVDSVEVRSHVWGYLEKVNFKEGTLVTKGDVLLEIDPRPYQAMLNQAKAKVAQEEAQLGRKGDPGTQLFSYNMALKKSCIPLASRAAVMDALVRYSWRGNVREG